MGFFFIGISPFISNISIETVKKKLEKAQGKIDKVINFKIKNILQQILVLQK